MERSHNHQGFYGTREYFLHAGQLFSANRANPLNRNGYRQGARWECYARDAESFLARLREYQERCDKAFSLETCG